MQEARPRPSLKEALMEGDVSIRRNRIREEMGAESGTRPASREEHRDLAEKSRLQTQEANDLRAGNFEQYISSAAEKHFHEFFSPQEREEINQGVFLTGETLTGKNVDLAKNQYDVIGLAKEELFVSDLKPGTAAQERDQKRLDEAKEKLKTTMKAIVELRKLIEANKLPSKGERVKTVEKIMNNRANGVEVRDLAKLLRDNPERSDVVSNLLDEKERVVNELMSSEFEGRMHSYFKQVRDQLIAKPRAAA